MTFRDNKVIDCKAEMETFDASSGAESLDHMGVDLRVQAATKEIAQEVIECKAEAETFSALSGVVSTKRIMGDTLQ